MIIDLVWQGGCWSWDPPLWHFIMLCHWSVLFEGSLMTLIQKNSHSFRIVTDLFFLQLITLQWTDISVFLNDSTFLFFFLNFTINHTCSRWVDTRSTDFVKPHCGVLNVLLHFWHSNRLPVFIHFCVMIIAISRKLFFSITLCPLLLFGLIGSLNFVTTQR